MGLSTHVETIKKETQENCLQNFRVKVGCDQESNKQGFQWTDDVSYVNLSKRNSCLHIGFRTEYTLHTLLHRVMYVMIEIFILK